MTSSIAPVRRPAAPPVVDADLRLTIAGLTVAVEPADPALDLRLGRASSAFVDRRQSPDLVISVETGNLSARATGILVFDSGALWRLYRDQHALVYRFTSPKFGSTPYKTAAIDASLRSGRVRLHTPYLREGQTIYPLEYPLDELLLINILAEREGVELHASGIIDRTGRGHLFAGPSGAGKTTISRLWRDEPGVTVLSDDRVVLRRIGGRIMLYGTPWHGDEPLASPLGVPLASICLLHHGTRHQARPLTGATAVARLFAVSFPPFHTARGLDATVAVLDEVARQVPCFDLDFVPDASVLGFARTLIA